MTKRHSEDIQVGSLPRHDHAGHIAVAFEQLLRRHGLRIEPGSYLEHVSLNAIHLAPSHGREPGQPELPENARRVFFRDQIGLIQMALLLLNVEDHPDFPALIPHLALLNRSESLQVMPSRQQDQASNKVFELMAGAFALQCGASQVNLDDHARPRGDNPDVLFTLAGRRWGIACKVLHSRHPEAFLDRLEEGLRQLRSSEAKWGVVMFSLKNVLDHDSYWPMFKTEEGDQLGVFKEHRLAMLQLRKEIERWTTEVRAYLPKGYLKRAFQGGKTIPGYMLWANTVCDFMCESCHLPRASGLASMTIHLEKSISSSAYKVLASLRAAAYLENVELEDLPIPGALGRPQNL
jgi:hypothetical protein